MTYKLTNDLYQQGLDQGKFLALKCNACNAYTFPPLAVCRECARADLEVTEIQGLGAIRTFTVIRVPPQGMPPNIIVAMVEMDEGPWVIGNVEGLSPDEAGMDLIGRRVKLGSRVVPGDIYAAGDTRVLTFTLT